jgi:hypothetical protein
VNADLDQAEINARNLHSLLLVIHRRQVSTGTALKYGSKAFSTSGLTSEDKAYVTSTARAQGWIEDREVDGHRWLSITGVGILILNSLEKQSCSGYC